MYCSCPCQIRPVLQEFSVFSCSRYTLLSKNFFLLQFSVITWAYPHCIALSMKLCESFSWLAWSLHDRARPTVGEHSGFRRMLWGGVFRSCYVKIGVFAKSRTALSRLRFSTLSFPARFRLHVLGPSRLRSFLRSPYIPQSHRFSSLPRLSATSTLVHNWCAVS